MVMKLGNVAVEENTNEIPLRGLFSDLSSASFVLEFKAIKGESDLIDQINKVDTNLSLEEKVKILTEILGIENDQFLFLLAGNQECFDRDQDVKNIVFKSELMSSVRKKFSLNELETFFDQVRYSNDKEE